jgi:hypothetical protein
VTATGDALPTLPLKLTMYLGLRNGKVYEQILVILNKPNLPKYEEKRCQLNESPEVEQKAAKAKAR